jgi:hypothetical protein
VPKPNKIPITIANILIELTSPLSVEEMGIGSRFGAFFGTNKNPIAQLGLCWENGINSITSPGELIYDPGSIWKMYRSGYNFQAVFAYNTKNPQSRLLVNPSWNILTLTEQPTNRFWTSILNFGAGELILRTAILFTGGVVFHASLVDDNGKGILFVGHSGEGKSTIANLWSQVSGAIIINEDRVAVRSTKTGAMGFGIPWGGSANITRNHQVPISAIILLEQSTQNDIQHISPFIASSSLITRTFLPYWDQTLLLLAMSNLNNIINNVQIFRVRFRPDTAIVPLIQSVL